MTSPQVIKSLQHPLVKHLVKLRTSKRYRRGEGRIVLCSSKLVAEAAPRTTIHSLLFSEESAMYSRFTPQQIFRVPPEILKKISGLGSATDCIAEIDLPSPSPLDNCSRLLVLDRLNDPGNVGTLARTALALGWDGLFLTEGTADPFNDKALRASRGAFLTLPYQEGAVADLKALLAADRKVYIADTHGTPIDLIVKPERLALILSSEAHGPDAAIAQLGERITIPMPGKMESLNVAIAGGILTFCLS
jgi:RNA methyltransferase, TrmH family